MPRLSLVTASGLSLPVVSGDVFGRTAKGRDALKDELSVSRMHARFDMQGERWSVTDLGARNGTFVGEQRLQPEAPFELSDGMKLKLGGFEFTVLLQSEPPAKEEGQAWASGTALRIKPPLEDSIGEADQGERRTLVVMFCRLRDSEDYFLREGTMAGRRWIFDYYKTFTSIVTLCGGEHLKNVNDVTLSIFDDPLGAARAALILQGSLSRHNETTPEKDIYKLHIGLSHGTVLYAHKDVYGNAVNIASRIQSIAPPGSIYVSEDFQSLLVADRGLNFRFVDNVLLKGVKQKVGIYELLVEGPYIGDVQ